MEVSIERPSATAAAEQPLPNCNVISFDRSTGVDAIIQYLSVMERWAIP
jgi:23S rRNA maturation mini-RNase III